MHQPDLRSWIQEPANDSHKQQRRQAGRGKTLQQHRHRQMPPTQHGVTAKQPTQQGVEQKAKEHPGPEVLNLTNVLNERTAFSLNKKQPNHQGLPQPIEQQSTTNQGTGITALHHQPPDASKAPADRTIISACRKTETFRGAMRIQTNPAPLLRRGRMLQKRP